MYRPSFITILLTIFLSMTGAKAFAHDIEAAYKGKPIYYVWANNNTELAVSYRGSSYSSYNNEYTGNVVIPESVDYNGNTYPVTSIGDNAFYECSGLTSVTIPNSVTSIGNYAFNECSGLTSVTIPNSVTSIGSQAFFGCSTLNSLTIPENVTSIGIQAFNYCGSLTSITVENGNTKYDSRENCNAIIERNTNKLLFGCKNTIIPNSVNYIEEFAFFGCKSLTSMTIPCSVSSIGQYAFSDCSGLISMTINDGVTSIGVTAFKDCSSLTSITIPNSVVSIGGSAFWNCQGLTSITIPANVSTIGGNIFVGCQNMSEVIVSQDNTKYASEDGVLFNKDKTELICYPEGKQSSLYSIPTSVTKILGFAFYGSTFLSTILCPKNLRSIGNGAFGECTSLETIVIPWRVQSIGGFAFSNCKSLLSITSESKAPFDIEDNVFGGNQSSNPQENVDIYSTATLYVPTGTKALYQSKTGWGNFKNIEEIEIVGIDTKRTIHVATAGTLPDLISEEEKYDIEELTITGELNGTDFRLLRDMAGNNYLGKKTNGKLKYLDMFNTKIVSGGLKYLDTKWISWEDGGGSVDKDDILYVESNVIPCKVFAGCSLNTIIIPNTVETICDHAFWHSQLNTIVISNSVLTIKKGVFDSCKLQSLTIPSSVTSIETPILSWNNDLEIIKVDEKNGIYDSRDNCNAIIETQSNTLVAGCKKTKIPNTVTTIGRCAFLWCESLTSITIPYLVRAIENQAFYGCSGLTSVTIGNSVTSISNNAFEYCSGLTSITVESGNQYYDSRNNCNAIIKTASNTLIVGCKNSTIPNSVTSIGERAFSGCSGLASITIPNSVTSIGGSAFSGCKGLTSVTIPNSVTSIGGSAFQMCSGLTSITIPNSVTSIGGSAFNNTGWYNFQGDGILYLDNWLVGYKGEKPVGELVITDGTKGIADQVFYGCRGLTSVSIPNSVTSIGSYTFYDCSGLSSITIPNSVTSIGCYAFSGTGWYNNQANGLLYLDNWLIGYKGDKPVGDLIILDGTKGIVGRAFYGCSGLTSVTIPNSVTFIGERAFWNCSSLTSITSEIEEPYAINENVFSNRNALLKVPAETKSLYEATDGWKSFKNIVEASSLKRTIHVATAGTLPDLISEDEKYLIAELTLTGELNGTDLRLIRDMAGCNYLGEETEGQLEVLDFSGAKVVAGGEKYVDTNRIGKWGGSFSNTVDQDNILPPHVFMGCKLTSVNISATTTAICDFSFALLNRITSIVIPNTTKSIGSAFRECSSLTSITIPSSVTSISSSAFDACSGLTSINVESGNQYYDSRNNCNAIIETASNTLIVGCKNTTIPNSVTSIGSEAFFRCSGLTSITIPNSVTSIGDHAFSGCSGLTSVTIPNSVASIGIEAFRGCSGLTSVTIPNSVTSIGGSAFNNTGWYNFQGDGILYLDNWLVGYKGEKPIGEIVITDGTKGIAGSAFEMCSGLTSITIPNSVKSIGSSALGYCSGLTSVTIPNSVTSIGSSAFWYCSGLTSITIPNSVTSIGSYTFYNCIGLTSITIPNSVTSIGNQAFQGCSGLTSVTIPNSVTSIGRGAFYGCGLTNIVSKIKEPFKIDESTFPIDAELIVPVGTKTLYEATDGWKSFKNIVEASSKRTIHVATAGTLPDLISEDEKFDIEELTITGELNGTDIKFINEMAGKAVSNNINKIHSETEGKLRSLDISNAKIVKGGDVYDCYNNEHGSHLYGLLTKDDAITPGLFTLTKLESILLPNSVTSVSGMYYRYDDDENAWTYMGAFPDCLKSVTIPQSVTSIDAKAFYGCTSLNSIKVENGNQYYDSRDNCNAIIETNTNTLVTGCKNTNIPNSVTSIGSYAFIGCNSLTSISIPNSVTSIGESTFRDCSNLTSVTIGNSVTSIGNSAFRDCSNLTFVTIGNSVTSIGSFAFRNCSDLTSVSIPNSVTSIGSQAFRGCSGLTSVTIPNSVTSIGSQAFRGCSGLTSVTIGNSVTSIGFLAFSGCSGLTSINIPSGVTSIGNSAFSGCSGLTSAIIGNGVTSIGNAFAYCNNLQEIILSQAAYDNGIPESVTKFTTYSKNPMRVEVVSKGVVSATMKIYPIDEQGNTTENNYYTVTTSGQTPGQYIKWKLDDENYGIISEKTEGTLTLVTQPAQPTSTTKARLIATVNEADDDQHFGFEWLRNDAPDNMPANMVSAPLYDGHIIGSLGGLNPDIYYKYRAFYKPDAGEMVYGEWVPFLTGDANVFFEPEVHNKEAIVTNDGALLSAVFIEGTEDIQEKGFEYWPMNSNARAVSLTRGNNISLVIVSGNNTSVTIEGLEAGTEYGYRPYVKTASGTTYGEEKTFKTSMFGDVNGDNKVDHDDLNDLVSYIMGNNPEHFDKDAADLNNDKKVNAADIVKMVKILK